MRCSKIGRPRLGLANMTRELVFKAAISRTHFRRRHTELLIRGSVTLSPSCLALRHEFGNERFFDHARGCAGDLS